MECPHCHCGMDSNGRVMHRTKAEKAARLATMYRCPRCGTTKIVEFNGNGEGREHVYGEGRRKTFKGQVKTGLSRLTPQ